MAHAHHFLSRLDRVSMPQVELALGLYRDEPLLRYIIERAKIPESIDKVALSLDHPEQGPFLIVTRAGRFVTCLGSGMKPREDQPIITKGQLDAFAAKAEDLRFRMAMAKSLSKGKGVQTLLRRVYDAGDALSREEFIALSALHPLYAREFLALHYECAKHLLQARDVFIPILKKTKKPKPIYHESLQSYWNTFWAMGNFLVLAGMSDTISDFFIGLKDELKRTLMPTWAATRQGWFPLALRGAWVAGRLGKPMLANYKRYYQEAATLMQTLDSGLGLLALGFRHARLKAEVEKALATDVPEKLRGTALGTFYGSVRKLMHNIGSSNAETLAIHLQCQRDMGSKHWIKATEHLPPGPFRFEKPEDVPEELALTYAVNEAIRFSENRPKKGTAHLLFYLFQLVPWVAKTSAEQLYLPKDAISVLSTPWKPEHTIDLIEPLVSKGTAHVSQGPPRQGACPCGSGKKYKRCCEEKDKDGSQ